MRIIAIITSYNESRFIAAILQHYLQHGIEVYLLDNESTDDTVEIASQYLNENLIQIKTIPRSGKKEWSAMLKRKEHLAETLKADWLIHADPDEFRLPPNSNQTLAQAIEEVDGQGYNAINFMEYTFVPTLESPNHDHNNFLDTMNHYYPFLPRPINRLNGWKQPVRKGGLFKQAWKVIKNRKLRQPLIDLASTGGHQVNFEGINRYPQDFKMRHYIVLSLEHARRKYVEVSYEEAKRRNNWRGDANSSMFHIPSQAELSIYSTDDDLDPRNPRKKHIFVSE